MQDACGELGTAGCLEGCDEGGGGLDQVFEYFDDITASVLPACASCSLSETSYALNPKAYNLNRKP